MGSLTSHTPSLEPSFAKRPCMMAATLVPVANAAGGPYLPVHSPNHSGLDTHAADEADMEVLVQHQRLQAGTDEQQRCVEIALPVRRLCVVHKVDEQPVRGQRET